MPLLSFSVPGQKRKILNGTKTQTMRRPRKPRAEINVSDKLFLWWKSRSKFEKDFLGETVCIEKFETTLSKVWNDEENAIRDGFNNIDEFRNWFIPNWENTEELELKAFLTNAVYDVIRWRYPLKTSARREIQQTFNANMTAKNPDSISRYLRSPGEP